MYLVPRYWHFIAVMSQLISISTKVTLDILTGKAEGQQMFIEQKYTVEGEFVLTDANGPSLRLGIGDWRQKKH